MSCVLLLLMTIDVVVVLLLVVFGLVLWGCFYPSFYIQGEQGYKEDPRVGYNYSPDSISSLS
jgi:hypothetical protein